MSKKQSAYIPRALESTVTRASQSFPVVLVTGPRQVGKTTMLQHLAASTRTFVSLDDPEIRQLARRDPGLFLQRYTPPLLIDEIQYAPELLPHIKMRVDATQERGAYWLTGSQAFHLMQNVSESLAGRVAILTMLGLSGREIARIPSEPFTTDRDHLLHSLNASQRMSLDDIFARIHRGSMPALYAYPQTDLEQYYSSYVNSYLQRDISQLAQVGDAMAFFNFLGIVAAHTACPVVYDTLAREAGISAPTAKKWLSLLVSSHIVALVQPYSNNLLKRATKMPLLHFLDTGLCAHLLGWNSPTVLERGAMAGAFFESHVFAEIYKSWINAGKTPPLFYYRDKDKREIDIILVYNGQVCPVEIKKAVAPGHKALKHFALLSPSLPATHSMGPGAVVCMANDLLPADAQNNFVPAWLI